MIQKQFSLTFYNQQYACSYIRTREMAIKALEYLDQNEDLMGVDIETCYKNKFSYYEKAALSPHTGQIRLLQISTDTEIFVFDVLLIGDFSLFTCFLSTHKFVAHNAVFELSFFKYYGCKDLNIGCTMIGAQLLVHAIYEEDEGFAFGLKPLIKQYFDFDLPKDLQVSQWATPELTYEQIVYAALDACACLELGKRVGKGIKSLDLGRIYQLQKAVQAPVVSIGLNGMCFDTENHEQMINTWRDDLYQARNVVIKMTGLSEVTGHKMSDWFSRNLDANILASWPRTASKKLSTDAKTLEDYGHLPVVRPYLYYKKIEKNISTYGSKLLTHINPGTGNIHSGLLIGRARTGRFASLSPNQQNYPRLKKFRSLFIAGMDRDYICADYSQIEIRVAAEISRDPVMLSAYQNGLDLHGITATSLYGKTEKDMAPDEWKKTRQGAKAVSLGLLFGLGAPKLGKYVRGMFPDIVFSEKESLDNKNKWSELYKGYKDWHYKQAQSAKYDLMVSTAVGKKRKISEKEHYPVSANNPIQGSACEIMESAMIDFERRAPSDLKLCASVHDELLISCPKDSEKDYIPFVEECMMNGYLNVFPNATTLKGLVEAHVGQNWSEAK